MTVLKSTSMKSMFKELFASFCLVTFVTQSHSTPITITQSYSNVIYDDYGVPSGVAYGANPTGDWIFKGTVESDAIDLWEVSHLGGYELSQLTITQASLGLFDMPILNAPFLFIYPDRFGFANTINGGSPWTVVVYEDNHFSSVNTLEGYLSLVTTPLITDDLSSFGPQWTGFELQDGRWLYGTGSGVATITVSAVPEPGTLALFGLGGLMGCFLAAPKTRRTHSH
ncbi:PEP-CTERM sorting domain-containing protein [Aquabacterium sp. A3]|uniref:PEP-CTERM sorting domain-containing protein n=1 Tax=Aquabacterium sp. A3 TaxID=3132829 RepID=UPI003119C9E6